MSPSQTAVGTSQPSAASRILNESPASSWWGWYLSACFAGLAVPGLILVGGVVTKLLEDGGLTGTRMSLGHHLVIPFPELLVALEPIEQLMWLVGVGLGLAFCQALALWWFYRGIYARSRQVSMKLHEQVLNTTLQIAASEGITAQRKRTGMLVDEELPQVQAGLIARWRAMPRSLVLAVLCAALALSVDVWLTLLAAISGLIVFRSFRGIEQFGKARAEAYDVPQIRRRLVETVQTAPLISRVRGDETPVNESGGPLGRLMEAGKMLDLQRSRSVPILTAASAIVISLMVVALGGSMLVETTPITLPAAMVLSLSLIGTVVGAVRVLRFFNQKSDFVDACENVCHFIDRGTDAKVSERMGLGGRQHAIGMSGVTLYDGGGRILLNEISLKLEPSSVVAFLGTDPTAVNSLAELLLGFGNPRSGKVTVGEVPMSELHERWLSKNVLWIGRSGPVWSGTITENLGFGPTIPDNGQISEATRRVGVYDRLQTLPDGFATLISADDNRLDEQTRYGIGIARAWIRRPAVIVVQEPPLAAGTLTDDQGMDALCELAKMGSLVIVLPQRLRSLRMADRVILLNGANLAGEGKHEELLATSDLYRHLNYVLFNPYRHMTPSGV